MQFDIITNTALIYPENFEKKIGFEPVRARLEALCVSALGAERVGAMAFTADFGEVSRRLRSTAEMLAIVGLDQGLTLDNFTDSTPALQRIRPVGTFITVDELLRLRRSLGAIEATASFFANARRDGQNPYPTLDIITADLAPFPEISRQIDRIMDRFGNIKDNASPELAQIRSDLGRTSSALSSIMRRVIARGVGEGVLDQDVAPTMRDGRLVIPVSPMNKRKISGIVHDESASGKTFFIEPAEIVEANNRIRELQIEEKREITRILAALTDTLRADIDILLIAFDVMGELDFIRAKALYAAEVDATLPNLSEKTELEWYHACHPVLLESLRRQGKEIVPLDIELTPKSRILIISGPNAGGKSVCLKTVGIIQYMTQLGLLPTVYDNSHIGIFSNIFIDIGDDQSIEDDLSTYSSHLRNMKHFLRYGSPTTLALIDEFGGGTEPQIGGAIAQAILKEFNAKEMWGVITTHYQNLKHFADETDGLVNGSMLYDRHLMQPLFRLSIGSPGSSFALEIARKTGLPASIIADAEDIVGSDYINLDRYLLDITRDKRYWENKRLQIKQKEKKIEEVLSRYEQEATQLREKRREIIGEAKEEARRILEGSNATIERTIREIRTAQADKERTREAREKLRSERQQILAERESDNALLRRAPKAKKATPKPEAKKEIAVGDNVRLDGQGTVGTVAEISGKQAVVNFGMMRTSVALNRLVPTEAKPKQASGQTASYISAATSDSSRRRQLDFKQEIDVRGMRVDEAIQAVTYFIDDAIQFNAARVRILHGTGTGALRQSLRQYLDTVPGVKSYADEDVRFGGAGITVVNLA